MANDCLVTKLKGTVNNSSLPILNKIKMERVTGGSESVFGINPGLTPELVITSGSLTLNKRIITTSIGGWGQHPEIQVWSLDGSGEGYVLLPKYETTRFYVQQNAYIVDLPEQFKYSNLEMLYLVYFSYVANEDTMEFTIQDLVQKCPNLQYLALLNQFHVPGSYGEFTALPLEILTAVCNSTFRGSVADWGKIPTLKSMSTVTGQYGDVWDLVTIVDYQREVGVAAGNIKLDSRIVGWERARFNGAVLTSALLNQGDGYLRWTSNPNTITACGQTISR